MIRNLPFSIQENQFMEIFSRFGEIEDSVIVKQDNGKSRGYGFVTYKSRESTLICLQHDIDICGMLDLYFCYR